MVFFVEQHNLGLIRFQFLTKRLRAFDSPKSTSNNDNSPLTHGLFPPQHCEILQESSYPLSSLRYKSLVFAQLGGTLAPAHNTLKRARPLFPIEPCDLCNHVIMPTSSHHISSNPQSGQCSHPPPDTSRRVSYPGRSDPVARKLS